MWQTVIAGIVEMASLMANSPGITHSPSQLPRISPETGIELRQIGAVLLDWKFWLKVAIIIAAPLWIYSPVYHGGWLMDDDFYLYRNGLLDDPLRLWKAWFAPGSFIEYYPIEQSVQWAQWQLWRQNTFGYHLTNILLHSFSALLVWRLLDKFRLRWAWWGGLLFAVHPALVESVVWIAELKNTLSLPPFLIAICFYLEYENHGRKRDYFFALGCFIAAMLCKVSMSPFPAVILLYAWWRRDRIDWLDVKTSVPFWMVSLGLVIVTLWCGEIFSYQHGMDITFKAGGWLFRVALIGQNLGFYVATSLWPFGLLPMYPRWPLDQPSLPQFLPWPIILATLYWFWTNRATWGRHALLGFGFFALHLAPFLGFILISYMRLTWAMDHFLYIAIIGLIGLFIAAVEGCVRRVSPRVVRLTYATMALVMGILSWSAHQYSKMFVDQKVLWTFTIANNPLAFAAYNNLGSLTLENNSVDSALGMFEKALDLNPDYFEARYNKGLSLERLKRLPEAIVEYRKSTELSPKNMDARIALAKALEMNGDLPGAVQEYLVAVRYNPNLSNVHASLGSLFVREGRFREAANEFDETIRLYPNAASPHNDFGNALYMLGHTAMAMDEYREALRLNPQLVEAHNNLGGALQHSGHMEDAIREFIAALQLDPSNPKLNINLANALVQAGEKQEAVKLYTTALRFDPNNAEAKAGLAALQGVHPANQSKK